GPNGAIETFRAPRARDDADGGIVSTCAPASGSQFPIGSTTVTCTATDAHGNAASVSFRVVVADTTAPVITDLPGNLRIEATSAAGAPVAYATPTATDAVDGAVAVVCAPASGATFRLGNTTVRCTATDAAGNSRTRSFGVTVRDTTAPTILGAADQTIEATSFNPVRVFFTPTAVDLVDGPVALTCSPRLPPQGILLSFGQSVVVRCSALDRSGNRSNTTTTLSVADTTAPRFVLTDMVVEATSPRGASVRVPAPFVDALDRNPNMACQGLQGYLPIGTTTITCRATDFSGNRATGSITITVRDTTGPAWSSLPSSSPVAATSAAGRSVSFAPVAVDVVTGPATAVCAPASGSVFPIGATTVTCTASDATGHASSTSFVVTVADTAPVVTVPGSMVVEANRTTGALVVFTASALDAVDGARSVACVPASGSVFPFGATNVVCRSTDSAGNQASNGFTVRVADTLAPTISVPEVTPNMRVFRGQQVPITINCADSGSGVATCRPISGAHLVGTTWYLDTGIFDLGRLSLIARDVAGNVTRLTINYRFR
nr:HYR domain-containing protein [Acidobacteriota bacterium]